MYPEIISLGELLVEIIRKKKDIPHGELGAIYKGPYPSGAPAIYIDTAEPCWGCMPRGLVQERRESACPLSGRSRKAALSWCSL